MQRVDEDGVTDLLATSEGSVSTTWTGEFIRYDANDTFIQERGQSKTAPGGADQ